MTPSRPYPTPPAQPTLLQADRLRILVNEMREIATRIGPLHASWDIIMEADALLNGEPQRMTFDAEMLSRLLIRMIDESRTLSYRLGWFWSSSNPRERVRCLAQGDPQIAEYERHKDFICWINERQTPL